MFIALLDNSKRIFNKYQLQSIYKLEINVF